MGGSPTRHTDRLVLLAHRDARREAVHAARRVPSELLAEWVFGEGAVEFDSEWAARGRALEPQARDFYSFVRSCEVRSIGLAYRDDSRTVAASPDGIVGYEVRNDGALELKCPAPKTHLLYLARDVLPREYVMQVQGQLWVTQLPWVDFMSYCPSLPPFIVRVEPEPKIQAALDFLLPAFVAELEAGRKRLIELGVQPWKEAIGA